MTNINKSIWTPQVSPTQLMVKRCEISPRLPWKPSQPQLGASEALGRKPMGFPSNKWRVKPLSQANKTVVTHEYTNWTSPVRVKNSMRVLLEQGNNFSYWAPSCSANLQWLLLPLWLQPRSPKRKSHVGWVWVDEINHEISKTLRMCTTD